MDRTGTELMRWAFRPQAPAVGFGRGELRISRQRLQVLLPLSLPRGQIGVLFVLRPPRTAPQSECLLLSLLVAILLMGAAYKLYGRLARRFREGAPLRYYLTILLPILAMLVPLCFLNIIREYLTLRGTPFYVVSFGAKLTALLASLVVVFGASSRIAAVIIASPQINPQGLNAQLIRITCRLLSLLAAVVIFLEGGHYLGIPVTTLVASAGIGGLALALAAQDTLKTLLGTIMLLSDKPFRVGEPKSQAVEKGTKKVTWKTWSSEPSGRSSRRCRT